MRVLHISTDDTMGAGQCCLRIHKALLNAGVESKVVVQNNTKHETGEYEYGFLKGFINRIISKVFRLMGLRITETNKLLYLSRKYHGTYTSPLSSINLLNNEWINWADVIHLHWVNNYLDYPSFFKSINKPVVWTLHDENLFYGMAHHHKCILHQHPKEIKYRKIKYDAVHCAKNLTIVFLSQMMYDTFHNEKIIEGRNMAIINNSVDTDVFKPQDRVSMRRKHGFDADKKIFVLIALDIADTNKGLDLLSEVLLKIAPEAGILAIGGNPSKREWKNVRSVGRINTPQEMCELVSCADYMAMPSFQEAFSQSPIEAMACGLPVVAFPVSGTAELINEKNGVICEDFTHEALKDGIQTILSSHYDPNEIRNDVISRFSPQIMAEKYISLYSSVINN